MGPWCAKPPLTYIINPSRLLWLHEGCEEKFIKLTDSIADHNATQRTNRAHAHVYFYTLLSATQLKHGYWLYTHNKMADGRRQGFSRRFRGDRTNGIEVNA
jgi:hypothetical protein